MLIGVGRMAYNRSRSWLEMREKVLIGVFGVLLVIAAGSSSAYACVCASPSVCEGHSLAEQVFVGTLISKEREEKDGREVIVARFRTGKVFKGVRGELTKTVHFSGGGCEPMLSIGEKYLVFDIPVSVKYSLFCNPTRRLRDAAAFLKYARYAAKHPNDFSISGHVIGLPASSLAKASVKLSYNGRETILRLNAVGEYAATIPAGSSYTVEITFANQITGSVKRLASSQVVDGRTISFSSVSLRGSCDDRRIELKEH